MVLVTRQAPDFTAAAVLGNGEIVEKFNFKQHTNGKPTVLFFWPMDFTFVCPTELEDLAANYDKFTNVTKNSRNAAWKWLAFPSTPSSCTTHGVTPR